MKTDRVFNIFIFSTFLWFSNRAVLAYMIQLVLLIGFLFLEIDI